VENKVKRNACVNTKPFKLETPIHSKSKSIITNEVEIKSNEKLNIYNEIRKLKLKLKSI